MSPRRVHIERALTELGGVASARALADHLRQGGPRLSTRQVREALRGSRVERIGGGYLALPRAASVTPAEWLCGRLRRHGPRTVDTLVEEVLARWPHGDPAAIRSWLRADPRGVVVLDEVVRLVEGWEQRSGGLA